jgi:hypothetical protein
MQCTPQEITQMTPEQLDALDALERKHQALAQKEIAAIFDR